MQEDRDIVRSLTDIIVREKAAKELIESGAFAITEKSIEPMLIAGLRMKGRYNECGRGFRQLGKIGRYICGKAMCLFYDGEYREDDADFEPCFPIRKTITAAGLSVRALPGGSCLTLVHRGPYDQLGRSYARLLHHARQ